MEHHNVFPQTHPCYLIGNGIILIQLGFYDILMTLRGKGIGIFMDTKVELLVIDNDCLVQGGEQ